MHCFPEELIERILDLVVLAPVVQRPHWHTSSSRARTSPLLVSKKFLRIGTPSLYHSIELRSSEQTLLLLATLKSYPELAVHIRHLTISAIWRPLGDLLPLLVNLLELDVTLDGFDITLPNGGSDEEMECHARAFCDALLHPSMTGVRVLRVRKPSSVYPTVPKVRYVLTMLAQAVENWPLLEDAQILFRMSDDSASRQPFPFSITNAVLPNNVLPPTPPALLPPMLVTGVPQHLVQLHSSSAPGPITLLTSALSRSPALRCFTTQLPSLWNQTILTVSSNPNLEKVSLLEGPGSPSSAGPPVPTAITSTGMFMMEARKHQRLVELVRAGTPFIRTRAHTTMCVSNKASSSSLASAASAAARDKQQLQAVQAFASASSSPST